MRAWLESLNGAPNIRCILGYRGQSPCFGFFVGNKDYLKHGFIATRSAHLNATGDAKFDNITIEYNHILVTPDCPSIIPEILYSAPLRKYNEFVLPGVSGAFEKQIRNHSDQFFLTSNKQTSFYIDLSLIREANGDYLGLLSSNKRGQIRRSIREYEKGGAIQHNYARSAEQAEYMFDEMGMLHAKGWQARGKSGSFVNEYWVHFHKTLIRARFDSGEIHISRFATDTATLGYIYGFVYQGRFLFCQCGFNYQENNNLRPGLISHYMLIKYFAEQGFLHYDFLAGASAYKKSLASHTTAMYWLALQRRELRFKASRALKRLVAPFRRRPRWSTN